MIIAAVDPGIDRVSIAYFSAQPTGRWRSADLLAKARAFTCTKAIRTAPELPLVSRLYSIHVALVHELTITKPELLFVELPGVSGIYQRHNHAAKRMGGAMNDALAKLAWATGAIIGAATIALGERAVYAIPAQRARKEQRLDVVRAMLRQAEKPEIRNTDDLDAVGIGLGATWSC